MFIPISYRVKYKNYPYAPKATNASRSLGNLFTWPVVLFLAGIWFFLVFCSLTAILGKTSSLPVIIAAVSLVPVGLLFFRWKKWREERIDEEAKSESVRVIAMTGEERVQYEAELVKSGRRRTLWVIIGVIALFGVISMLMRVL